MTGLMLTSRSSRYQFSGSSANNTSVFAAPAVASRRAALLSARAAAERRLAVLEERLLAELAAAPDGGDGAGLALLDDDRVLRSLEALKTEAERQWNAGNRGESGKWIE